MSEEYLDRLNRVTVTAEDLVAAQDEIGRLARGERDFESVSIVIAERFAEDREPMKPAAILFRLQALQKIIGAGGAVGFIENGSPQDGYSLTARAVFEAAARCRLHSQDDDLHFDLGEFRRLAMEATKVAGRA